LSGRVFQPQQNQVQVGNFNGLMVAYAAPTPLVMEEGGHLILMQDGSGGYYELTSFNPEGETDSYRAVFDDVLRTFQFNKHVYKTDVYSGTVHNLTIDTTASLQVEVRDTAGKLSGCLGVVKPLYGSGPLTGSMKNGTVTFVVKGTGFDLLFRGKNNNGEIAGTYTVSPADGSVSSQQQNGEFSLERKESKDSLIQRCPTDAEMGAKDH
jgi:hypothetical protein